MKIIIVIVFSLLANYANCKEKVNCTKESEDNFDLNFTKMYLFGAPDRHYPTTDEQMKPFCRDNFELQNQLKSYTNKCVTNLSKQVVNLLLYSVSKNSNNVCKSQRKKRAFLRLGNCGNAAKADTVFCWNNFTLAIDGVSYYHSDSMKIPLLCCNFYRLRACFLKAYETQPRKCSQKDSEALDNLLNAYVLETLKLLCGEYTDENDKCDRIIGETPKSNLKTLPKSMASIAVRIFESFPEL